MNRFLIVIDMQRDFIDGALGTPEAAAILPAVLDAVQSWDGPVLFTRDTHTEDYLNTQEGRNLPVVHCVRGTEGWQLAPELDAFARAHRCRVFDKPTFGSTELAAYLTEVHRRQPVNELVLCGVCTDICVISNALCLKAALPEVPVRVLAGRCAGVTPERHETALRAMEACQVAVDRDA